MERLRKALRERYKREAYALFFEVRSATGFTAARAADAVAMGLYPSRGLELEGFEIKASRSDWLAELNNPDKAREVSRFCDRWWVVTTGPGIVKRADLPSTWGLLVLDKKGSLRALVRAPKLKSEPMTRGFIASLFREAQRAYSSQAVVEAEVKRRVEAASKDLVRRTASRCERAEKEVDYIRSKLRAFEGETGIRLSEYSSTEQFGRIGRAVKVVMDGDRSRDILRAELERSARVVAATARRLEEALAQLEAIPEEGE